MANRRVVTPFAIEPEDVANSGKRKKKNRSPVSIEKSKPRFQALSDDMIWIAEQDIARLKQELELREGPLTDKERHGFVKVSEQLRKLRWTEAELQRQHDNEGTFDDAKLRDELLQELSQAGVPEPTVQIVLRVLGLCDSEAEDE